MKRFTAVLLALALSVPFILIMSGCREPGPKGRELIGVVVPDNHIARWIKDGNTLKTEAEKRGYRAEVQFAAGDQAAQNQHIRSFLSLGAKLLIVCSVNETVVQAITETGKAKVPVIAYDRLILNSDDYDYYITFNNFKVGALQGEYIASTLDLKAVTAESPKFITLFAGSPSDGNAFTFFDGTMSVLNPYIEKGVLKVIGPYPATSDDRENFLKITTDNWQGAVARARMEELLKNEAKDVTLDAVLTPNDHIARAIIEACKADKYRDKLPITVGQDAEFESVLSIKNGEQGSTVFKNTTRLAEAAIILADQILKGQSPIIPGAVMASGNLERIGNTGKKVVKAFLLDPVLVTKYNLNVPVDAEFYTAAENNVLKE